MGDDCLVAIVCIEEARDEAAAIRPDFSAWGTARSRGIYSAADLGHAGRQGHLQQMERERVSHQ